MKSVGKATVAVASAVFFGSPALSARYLVRLLEEGIEVRAAVTRPPKRRSRGSGAQSTPVEEVARQNQVPVAYSPAEIVDLSADVGIVVAYGRLISDDLLSRMHWLNVHYSLLPELRGAAPIERAILAGLKLTGVSLMEVVKELDAGPVYDRSVVEVADKSAAQLAEELTDVGIELLIKWLKRDDDWFSFATAQNGVVSYADKITAQDLEIDWNTPAELVSRRVRIGRAFTYLGGRRIQIQSARPFGHEPLSKAGDLYLAEGVGYVIACAPGALLPLVVKPEGKGSMSFSAFLAGMGNYKETQLHFGPP